MLKTLVVSGHYMYLPATFIYKDLKQCRFEGKITEQHHPTSVFNQAFIHEVSSNYVMKYSIRQGSILSPFFLVAHAWASIDAHYPADGRHFYTLPIIYHHIFKAKKLICFRAFSRLAGWLVLLFCITLRPMGRGS